VVALYYCNLYKEPVCGTIDRTIYCCLSKGIITAHLAVFVTIRSSRGGSIGQPAYAHPFAALVDGAGLYWALGGDADRPGARAGRGCAGRIRQNPTGTLEEARPAPMSRAGAWAASEKTGAQVTVAARNGNASSAPSAPWLARDQGLYTTLQAHLHCHWACNPPFRLTRWLLHTPHPKRCYQ